jgi:hypothetical protein
VWLANRTIDVSSVTANGDAELRLIATTDGIGYGGNLTWGELGMGAQLAEVFTITSAVDVNGTGHVKRLTETVPGKHKRVVKNIGIPDAASSTHNKFGIDITYAPATAAIQRVRVTAKATNFGQQDLTFVQSSPAANGRIRVTQVGFAAGGTGKRGILDPKDDNMKIEISVEAQMPTVGTQTATALLGLEPVRRRQSMLLTPLYKAGRLPGAQRYSDTREDNMGGDSWGTRVAYFRINSLPSLIVFNDLSLEHGSDPPKHDSHQVGTSIDALYPGPGGLGNTLNDTDIADRRTLFQQARLGVQPALDNMFEWVRTVRANIDAIFALGSVKLVYISNSIVDNNPILLGTFSNGQPIVNASGVSLGAWQPGGTVTPWPNHLDHIHIEFKQLTSGNPCDLAPNCPP